MPIIYIVITSATTTTSSSNDNRSNSGARQSIFTIANQLQSSLVNIANITATSTNYREANYLAPFTTEEDCSVVDFVTNDDGIVVMLEDCGV